MRKELVCALTNPVKDDLVRDYRAQHAPSARQAQPRMIVTGRSALETPKRMLAVEPFAASAGVGAPAACLSLCPLGAQGIGRQRQTMMDDAAKKEVLARLGRIAVQVEGIVRMIDEDGCCVDILLQIASAQAALGQSCCCVPTWTPA